MKSELDMIEMGMRIRVARESIGMNRDQFAEKIPMSSSFLADVEGGTKGVSLEKFYRIVKVLDVVRTIFCAGTSVLARKNLNAALFWRK